MTDYFIAGIEETVDENGVKLYSFRIRSVERRDPLKKVMIGGIQIACGVALAAYTSKLDLHPIWPIGFSAVAFDGVTYFCKNFRKFFRKLPDIQKERCYSMSLLTTGTVIYFANVVAFSRTLKKNNKLWILYLAFSAAGYYLSVSSNTRFGRTVLNRTPAYKCFQLLFGPSLIGGAAYYLLSLQKHEEEWLRCLPLIASAAAANDISLAGYRRVESNNEPRWLLFKGLELFVGGCIMFINGAVLVVYAANNQFHPSLITFFTIVLFNGIKDITYSLESFQGCVEMEAPVFYSICGMIGGPLTFFGAFISVALVDHPIMLPAFIVIAGTGLTLLGKSIKDLHDHVPQHVFNTYCQRVLGPVSIVYSSLVSAYTARSMGWRYALVLMPLIPAGIYATYSGWK